MPQKLRILTADGPRWVNDEEWQNLHGDEHAVVYRSRRYGFNYFGACIEGADPAVHYTSGEDEVLLSTVQSPNGRFSFGLYLNLCDTGLKYEAGFCWDENSGWKDRPSAVMAGLRLVEDYLEDVMRPSSDDVEHSSEIMKLRIGPIQEYIKKQMRYWNPTIYGRRKTD